MSRAFWTGAIFIVGFEGVVVGKMGGGFSGNIPPSPANREDAMYCKDTAFTKSVRALCNAGRTQVGTHHPRRQRGSHELLDGDTTLRLKETKSMVRRDVIGT